jgi:cytochrome b subunit of formate dehydrogenase
MEAAHRAQRLDRIAHRTVWVLALVLVAASGLTLRHLGFSDLVTATTAGIMVAPVAAWWVIERRRDRINAGADFAS